MFENKYGKESELKFVTLLQNVPDSFLRLTKVWISVVLFCLHDILKSRLFMVVKLFRKKK